jgi:hypothetical protein
LKKGHSYPARKPKPPESKAVPRAYFGAPPFYFTAHATICRLYTLLPTEAFIWKESQYEDFEKHVDFRPVRTGIDRVLGQRPVHMVDTVAMP